MEIRRGCTSATLGCVDCKKIFLKNLAAFLEPLQERRAKLDDATVAGILAGGGERARAFAATTMSAVREKMGL